MSPLQQLMNDFQNSNDNIMYIIIGFDFLK
jgi:hypothetical protein